MKKQNHPTKPTYHHGDLKRALIESAETLIREKGSDPLSLREVARKAGVTHTAPYRHFKDKSELLAAVAGAGFERMNQMMAEAGDRHADRPSLRLEAAGRAYVAFAVANPNLFKLMFGPELAEKERHPDLLGTAAVTYGLLLAGVEACQQAGRVPEGNPTDFANACWSLVHGLAQLLINRQIPLIDDAATESLIVRTMDMLWRGLARGEGSSIDPH